MSRPAAAILRARGFSLLELLVVSAIIVVLVALTTPAVVPILRASQVNKAASMAVAELNLARQTALTRNRDIEIRFYQLGSTLDSRDLKFRAFRSFFANGNDPALAQPLSNLSTLPESVVISANPNFSTILDYDNPARPGLAHLKETMPDRSAPVSYVSFLFRPNGGTNLSPVDPPDGNWFLTLHLENASVNAATGLPGNYVTAQVEPVTGRVRVHRP